MGILNLFDKNQEGMKDMAKHLTSENFKDEVLKAGDKPVLVDFWAPWCVPCKMQGPVVEQMSDDGYLVGKVNIDEEVELASEYQVLSIPTLIVFKDGKEVDRMVGLQKKPKLIKAMEL